MTGLPLNLGCIAEVAEKVEVEDDFEQLAKELENASPLEIMDKALEKFGNEIAIAFRYYILFLFIIPLQGCDRCFYQMRRKL